MCVLDFVPGSVSLVFIDNDSTECSGHMKGIYDYLHDFWELCGSKMSIYCLLIQHYFVDQ